MPVTKRTKQPKPNAELMQLADSLLTNYKKPEDLTPGRPGRPSRASGWSSLTTPRGFPCCVRVPCVDAVATIRAQRLEH